MDITTSNIQPPAPPPSSQLDLSVQNSSVQAQATRLPVGVTISGSVVGNDKNGNLIVRLAGSDLILSSPLALGKNAQVTLQINNVSGSFTATLLSVDGKLPATQPQAVSNQLLQNPNALLKEFVDSSANARIISVLNQGAARPAVPTAAPPQAPIAAPADIVSLTSPETTVTGILVTAAPEITQTIKSAIALSDNENPTSELTDSLPEEVTPGSQLNLKITTVQNPPANNQPIETGNTILTKPNLPQPPATATQAAPEAEPMPEPTFVSAAMPQPTPATTTLPTDAKQIATGLQQLLQNFTASFKPLPNGNIDMNALVIDTKPGGELLVETRFGKMIIQAGPQFASVEKGATINLELASIEGPPEADINLPDDDSIQQLGHDWPALKNLTQQAADKPGMPTLATKLAGVESVFAGKLAAFINAVKSGNLRDWIGANTYDALDDDALGSSILGKVKQDMETIRQMANQPNGGWQTMLFPVYDGRDLQQARLHVKYLPDENNQPDKRAGTRFIVELETGHFGEIQMDGLVHNNTPSKHFDLIIRTHKPLDAEMETGIRQIFTDAGQITGFKGDLEFSTMKEFPLKVFDNLLEKNYAAKLDHKGIEA